MLIYETKIYDPFCYHSIMKERQCAGESHNPSKLSSIPFEDAPWFWRGWNHSYDHHCNLDHRLVIGRGRSQLREETDTCEVPHPKASWYIYVDQSISIFLKGGPPYIQPTTVTDEDHRPTYGLQCGEWR